MAGHHASHIPDIGEVRRSSVAERSSYLYLGVPSGTESLHMQVWAHVVKLLDIRTICNMEQTCKTWQACVLRATTRHLSLCWHDDCLQRVPHMLATWLQRHAVLVGQIKVFSRVLLQDQQQKQQQQQQQQHTLTQALAAAKASLQLGSLDIDVVSAELLLALSPTRLTELRGNSRCCDSSTTAALKHLTNLQKIEWGHVSNKWLRCVGRLSRLTSLCIAINNNTVDLGLLPPQLRELTVVCSEEEVLLALGHITGLRALRLDIDTHHPAAGSALPAGLTTLQATSLGLDLANVEQLQQLDIQDCRLEAQQLLALTGLPQLTSISLTYDEPAHALRTGCAWPWLSALTSLDVVNIKGCDSDDSDFDDNYFTFAKSLELLKCATTATSLARLVLAVDLELEPAIVSRHLTQLTRLTCLDISPAPWVDDLVFVDLALHLTRLCDLDISSCKIHSPTVLPVVASMLRGLTALSLTSRAQEPCWTAEQLARLTTLTGLRRLGLSGLAHRSAIDAVWDGTANDAAWPSLISDGKWR